MCDCIYVCVCAMQASSWKPENATSSNRAMQLPNEIIVYISWHTYQLTALGLPHSTKAGKLLFAACFCEFLHFTSPHSIFHLRKFWKCADIFLCVCVCVCPVKLWIRLSSKLLASLYLTRWSFIFTAVLFVHRLFCFRTILFVRSVIVQPFMAVLGAYLRNH